jgi:hypothetical protein
MSRSNDITDRKLVVVLGVHRSGTSLLAAGIESLGAYLGGNVLTESQENQKGFFENKEIVDFNERLLSALGGRWDNPLFDGESALRERSENALDVWYREADKIFKDNFSARSFIAIKDPRLCQLIPFWKRVFVANGYSKHNTFYAHIVRHPMEVAYSQQKRLEKQPGFYGLGKNPLEAVALWVSLTCQALRSVDSDHNLVMSYAQLLDEPKCQLERLAELIEVSPSGDSVSTYYRSFIERSMRHNTVDASGDQLLSERFPEAKELYLQQLALADRPRFTPADIAEVLTDCTNPNLQSNLSKPLIPLFSSLLSQRVLHCAQIASQQNEYDRLEMEVGRLETEVSRLETEVSRQRQIRAVMEEELDAVKKSRSWRATSPFRAVSKYLKH